MPSDLQRIITIGDSVFAVCLTLLAVGVRLPPDLIGRPLRPEDLGPLFSDIGAVALSFCVVSVFWIGHWVYLRQAVRSTVPFLISNLAVLLCITLIPISTRIWSAGPTSTPSVAIYSANLLATSFFELLFRRQAIAMTYPEGVPVPRIGLMQTLSGLVGIGVHGCALLMAFVHPRFAVCVWCCALFVPGIQVWTHRRYRKPA